METILGRTGSGELEARGRERLEECRRLLKRITSAGRRRDVEGVLEPLDRLQRRLGDVRRGVSLLRYVHPEAEARDSAARCERELADFATELSLSRGLFEAVKECAAGELEGDTRRLADHLLRDFHRSGVDRDEETRETVRRLRDELVELGQRFSRNIQSDVGTLRLEGPEELEGLPEDYRAAHPPGADGAVTITTDYPDYHPFMIYARSGRRREELFRLFRLRAWPENVSVLSEILSRRHRLATLLGYDHWADYVAEDKMALSGVEIARFIERVAEVALPRSRREYDALLERKRREEPEAERIEDWEKAYYEELVRAERFGVDSRELRPYFEYSAVEEGLLALAARLFEVEFRPRPDVEAWHEDVEVFDVVERGGESGRIYLDMHPRADKYKHAAMFPLVGGTEKGTAAVAALVCNFPRRGASGGPALLQHEEVVTFFHEFGHLLHHLFGRRSRWAEFSGTSTEWDFVEVPSQLFEEWAREPEVLRAFARHHQSGEAIPVELVERARRARAFGRGLAFRQQSYYARLSLDCHDRSPEGVDLEALQRDLQNAYSPFRFVEGTCFVSNFDHLEGYSALYYTYMWSLVIEKDLFGSFREAGLLDRETARRYRREVLEPGGSRDAVDLVRSFLGRDYGFEAFESWLKGD